MKILFLDVDGVLNSDRSFVAGGERLRNYPDKNDPYFMKITKCTIDPIACDLVNRLCIESGAKIVISSTHRLHFPDGPEKLEMLRKYFDFLGISGELIIGWTKQLHTLRGREIEEWLERHPSVTHYVILDDSSDMLPEQMEYFVRCLGEHGMTAQNYRDCARLFDMKDSGLILL